MESASRKFTAIAPIPTFWKNKSVLQFKNIEVECFQSNHEGALIDKIQEAYFEKFDGIVINPAGYTHTSVAIADALKGVDIPFVEVHISKVDEREDFRKISFVRNYALATISGKGFEGYLDAIKMLENLQK